MPNIILISVCFFPAESFPHLLAFLFLCRFCSGNWASYKPLPRFWAWGHHAGITDKPISHSLLPSWQWFSSLHCLRERRAAGQAYSHGASGTGRWAILSGKQCGGRRPGVAAVPQPLLGCSTRTQLQIRSGVPMERSCESWEKTQVLSDRDG